MSVNMMAVFTAVLAPNGIRPVKIIVRAERTRPTQRNFLASDLSETLPIMNFEKAYAMETADIARPALPASMIPSWIISGAAKDRFLRTR